MHEEDDHGSIENGTIGWGDADDDHFEIGEGDNEHLPLVRVTLGRGKGPIGDTEDRAQGNEVLCRWGMLIDFIPKKGTQCVVAFPAGMRGTEGGGVIIGLIRPNAAQFKEDRAMLAVGDDVHLLVKGKSVTLSDYGDGANTPTRWLMVGTSRGGGAPRILCSDETGSGWNIKAGVVGLISSAGGAPKAWVEVNGESASMARAGGEQLKLSSGLFYGFAGKCQLQGGGIFLGKMPTPVNPALWGFAGIAGAPSTSVFISAT